ncbi:hypothetical protein INT46_007232 [Mucor plumbeus]|uniref:Uncharacterized protein n=1 Tax=Mucor plumbeus TaxID=97098 RepID=A0A8H7RBW0_9FUNG|nr:hypothetical protein INT46_007232 [Mucor plumbeus]
MATLDAFLARGKKKSQSSIRETNYKHAFVNPFTALVKKPLPTCTTSIKPVKNQNKTITQYFTPMDMDEEMEEPPAEICTIRKKLPVMDLWNIMQYELDQDPFYNDGLEQKDPATTQISSTALTNPISLANRRRRRQSDVDQSSTNKRCKKTDHELSSIMARFLSMGTAIKHHPTNLDFLNEFSEEAEDLSRQVRHKQTIQESHLFVYKITQEFLY